MDFKQLQTYQTFIYFQIEQYSRLHSCKFHTGLEQLNQILKKYVLNQYQEFIKTYHQNPIDEDALCDYQDKYVFHDNNTLDKLYTKLANKQIDCCYDFIAYPNNSLSIFALLNFAKCNGARTIHIVKPSYFLVEEYCKLLNLQVEVIRTEYSKNEKHYHISLDDLSEAKCIWLTSPVLFSNFTYDINNIISLIEYAEKNNVMLIIDETLALKSSTLLKYATKNMFFINSPYKCIGINGIIKTSFVSASKQNIQKLTIDYGPSQDMFNYHSSLQYVNENMLNMNLQFFLSNNYDAIYAATIQYFKNNLAYISNEVSKHKDMHMYADDVNSMFVSIYVDRHISMAECFKMIDDIRCEIEPTYVDERTTSFRVSLGILNSSFCKYLPKVLDYLEKVK